MQWIVRVLQFCFGGLWSCAGKDQMLHMAEALAKLPGRVLWRLSPQEIPNKAAIEALSLGENTKVGPEAASMLSALAALLQVATTPSIS